MVNNLSCSPSLGKSDYLVIICQFICYIKKTELAFTKLNYFKGNYTKICLELEAVDWNQVL